ncbi:ABC transporter permease [Desulforamulus aeronauticus]|uniref:ABC-2 type transport system permease protein n=1 Tax=Desulforamulus aeronauticus DSM 10349 TaxID=1121421 RepID=A0A1M6TDB4_9FIRM|nr:ABC-2 family transporter protein [Desulforamulus aeronauticus]SHK54816.1 ABC-2 type transport system permease protein [Desulforamulus aeronauticus DSM 10349]
MVESWLRGISMYFYMVSASIRAQLQYRYAFIMNILGWAMTYAGTAITMWVLLYSFGTLEGWIFWELIFLFALAVLSWGVCMIFFFHFRSLDQYIVNGTFDRFLVRPIHPFFHFMAMKFDVGAFGQFLFSIVAVALSYSHLNLHWQAWQWLVFLGAVWGGTLIQGGLLVAISAMAFWTTRSERLYWVVMWPAKNLMNYPLTIYPRVIQLLVIFVLPFAFVNYLPALLLLGKTSQTMAPFWGFLSPFVGMIFFWLCFRLWMLGLNRYKSAGS